MPFPQIDPVIFSFELFGMTLALRWYALAYIVGLIGGWRLVMWLLRRPSLWPRETAPMPAERAEDLLTWMIIGVVLGGRLGFVLFYQPAYFAANPLEILRIDQGGMSFHGGSLGVLVGVVLWCYRQGYSMVQVGDAVAMVAPLGILLGRLANFVNGELWGRPTTVAWGVVFPDPRAQVCPPGWVAEACTRHPSQLYEAALEGALLGLVLWVVALRFGGLRTPGLMIGLFLAGYGAARSFVEGFRQGDAQFVSAENPFGQIIRFGATPDAFGLTMGQLLSLPMLVAGLAIIAAALARRRHVTA